MVSYREGGVPLSRYMNLETSVQALAAEVKRCREQARRVYYGAVSECKKEMPITTTSQVVAPGNMRRVLEQSCAAGLGVGRAT